MHALIIVTHLIVCFALILIVLLQTGKGASMGAMFGGAGNQTLFGNTGASTFLSKATTIAAVVFMLTSLTLAYVSKSDSDSVLKDFRPATEQQQRSAPEPGQTESGAPANSNATGTNQQAPPAEQPAQ